MVFTRFSRAGTLVLAMSLTSAAAMAKDGRDFAGYYNFADATDRGSQVEVTIKVQLYNYSGADLRQAVISLRPSHPGPGVLGTFTPIQSWRHGDDVILTQTLTVPREEYERWTSRNPPSLFITYIDGNRQEWQRAAQVTQRPTIPF